MKPINKKTFRIFAAVIIVSMAFCGVVIYQFMKFDDLRLPDNTPRIEGSDYYIVDGKIYSQVWGSVPYEVEGADAASFRVITDSPYTRSRVAADKDRVYCGTLAMQGLDPKRVRRISSQYYTDGRVSYYCSDSFVKHLNPGVYIFKLFFNAFGLAKFPQSYYFPYDKLDTNADITPLSQSRHAATDGRLVFYKGEILEGADVKSLRQIPEKIFFEDDFIVASADNSNNEILADERNIYIDGEKIPFEPSDKIYFSRLAGYRNIYLYDPISGAVYMKDERFDRSNEPYTPLNSYLDDDRYLLFLGRDGIFYLSENKALNVSADDSIKNFLLGIYYDLNPSKISGLKKISVNPFKGSLRQISSKVLKDDESFYYLKFSTHSEYVRRRYGKRLDHKTNFIELYRLKDTGVKDEKIVSQIARDLINDPEKSELIFSARDVAYDSREGFYLLALVFVVIVATITISCIRLKRLKFERT